MLQGAIRQEISDRSDPFEHVEGSAGPGSGRGGDRLNQQQRAFCRELVLNGGNQTRAAEAAGYSHPERAGARCILNGAIRREIERLSVAYVSAKLPWLIEKLCDIIEDADADPKARVSAILGLMDRAGMRPKTSPMVQINNLTQVNGADAQAAIKQVWDARASRMGAEIPAIEGNQSDIGTDMPDETQDAEPASAEPASDDAGDHPGGGIFDEAVVVPSIIPTPSSAHSPKTPSAPESLFDD